MKHFHLDKIRKIRVLANRIPMKIFNRKIDDLESHREMQRWKKANPKQPLKIKDVLSNRNTQVDTN